MLRELARMMAIIALACAVLFLVPLGGCIIFDEIISIDSLSTHRATGVTDTRFLQIKPGMTTTQVVAKLGQPLRIGKSGHEWWYSSPKEPIEGWGCWNARYLWVADGIVTEVNCHPVMNH